MPDAKWQKASLIVPRGVSANAVRDEIQRGRGAARRIPYTYTPETYMREWEDEWADAVRREKIFGAFLSAVLPRDTPRGLTRVCVLTSRSLRTGNRFVVSYYSLSHCVARFFFFRVFSFSVMGRRLEANSVTQVTRNIQRTLGKGVEGGGGGVEAAPIAGRLEVPVFCSCADMGRA